MAASFSTSGRLLRFAGLPFGGSSATDPIIVSHNSLRLRRTISFQRMPKLLTLSVPSSASSVASSLQSIEELPLKLQEIVRLFQSVSQPKAKYEQLLFYGKNLRPLDALYKTKENKVEGCVSQVWVRACFDVDRNIVNFEADSDSVLTKGLAALLVQGLSGSSVEDIVRVSPDFAVLLGLQQSLTPSRNNGFLNMLKLMQKKAVEAGLHAAKKTDIDPRLEEGGVDDIRGHDLSFPGSVDTDSNEELSSGATANVEKRFDSGGLGSRGMRITEILERELKPVELEVEDISYQHAGHAGIRGNDDGETHFNVKVVSSEFTGKSLVKRHRLIYGLLDEELQNGLHALSIVAKTPSEAGGVS